jgi:hypothetical protein
MQRAAPAVVAVLACAVILPGCLQMLSHQETGAMSDPHRFEGRLTTGDMDGKSVQIQERLSHLSSFSVTTKQTNDRATYQVTVDGLADCMEAHEAVATLSFILSRSACVAVKT